MSRHADDMDPPIFNVYALSKLPTLCVGQADDLKVETANERTWLSRCGRTDGACCNAHVALERCVDGKWVTVYEECHD